MFLCALSIAVVLTRIVLIIVILGSVLASFKIVTTKIKSYNSENMSQLLGIIMC